MSSNKSCSLLILFFLLLLSEHFQVSSSCRSECGGIDIPFPFGIGKDCYLNQWYAIACVNNSAGKLVPFLSVFKKEVESIFLVAADSQGYLSNPIIRIKNEIVSKGCSRDGRDKIESHLNLTGTPYYFTNDNLLVTVGCDVTASLTHIEPSMVVCKSICNTTYNNSPSNLVEAQFLATIDCIKQNSGEKNRTDSCLDLRIRNEKSCDGTGCCQEQMTGGIQKIVGVKIDNTKTTGGCNVAFLTDRAISSDASERLYATQYSTISLRWFIHTTNRSFEDSLGCGKLTEYNSQENFDISCVCDYNAFLNYSTCLCSYGYVGNPYVRGGCKDFNECQQDSNPCLQIHGGDSKCTNLQGTFKCSNPRPLIIGLSTGFGSLIFFVGIYFLFKFIKKQRVLRQKKKFFKRNGGLLLQQQLSSTEGNVEKTKVFSSSELEKATENFSLNRILGQGGQGTVCKGMLVDGRIVAVKKSKVVDEDKLEEFINEVVILSQINHRNVVKLLGCCLETDVPILVYEFISNGNLFEHLHDDSDDNTVVTWEIRLRIAVDIAGALSYLHSSASSPIYHRDIKSTNIMLDEKYRAKVSDFGTSRSVTVDHTHLTTVVSGTVGYVDPEYFQSSQFTDKSDVYSFGVVLVELITGEKSISYLRSQENRTLSTYFLQIMKEDRLFDIIDVRIRDNCKLNQVTATAKIARKCLNLKGRKRPSMREVSMELEKIQSSHGDMQQHECVIEEDEEKDEEVTKVNIGMESSNHVAVTAPTSQHNNVDASSSSWSDVEQLLPLHTW